jgi:hypothetical protein
VLGRDEHQKRTLVASQTLALASPIFNKMLNGRWIEGNPDTHEIPLPDDDPESMLIILRILHYIFKGLLSESSFEAIHTFAQTVDKWDIFSAVKPFVYGFYSKHQNKAKTSGHEEWLTIARIIGQKTLFFSTLG